MKYLSNFSKGLELYNHKMDKIGQKTVKNRGFAMYKRRLSNHLNYQE